MPKRTIRLSNDIDECICKIKSSNLTTKALIKQINPILLDPAFSLSLKLVTLMAKNKPRLKKRFFSPSGLELLGIINDLARHKRIKICPNCGGLFVFKNNKTYCSLEADGRNCGKSARDKRNYKKHPEKKKKKLLWIRKTRKDYRSRGERYDKTLRKRK